MRAMTYGGGKRSSLAPSVVLGRLFGPVDGLLVDFRAVVHYVQCNRVHAQVTVQNRAWCVCPRGAVCECARIGESGDGVYDAIRYALARLVAICQNYDGAGYESYIARLCMVAYLPLTRLYDASGVNGRRAVDGHSVVAPIQLDEAWELVDIDNVLSVETMPNLCPLVMSADFWYEGHAKRHGNVERVFQHVLEKAFPLRCHFRNMRKICVEYGAQHGEFGDWIYAVVRCSLMGLFPTCASSCGFEAIRRIDVLFAPASDLCSKERCEFVCRFNYVMFHAVKEYLCYLISTMSGMREILDLTYRWWMFDSRMYDTMHRLRLLLSDEFATVVSEADALEPVLARLDETFTLGLAADPESDDLLACGAVPLSKGAGTEHTSDDEAVMVRVEAVAEKANTEQEKNMYHMRRDKVATVIRLCLGPNACEPLGILDRPVVHEPFAIQTVAARLVRFYAVPVAVATCIANGMHYYFATGYVSHSMVSLLENESLDPVMCASLSRYCDDITLSSTFHFMRLPESLRLAQLQAIRRKYDIIQSETSEEQLTALSEVYYCLSCASFKAFVVHNAVDGLVSCGFVGIPEVVYDERACGIKCRQCVEKTQMFRFCMAGLVARIGRDTHVICTCCGSLTIFDPFSYTGDEYICATCIHRRVFAKQRSVYQLENCPLPDCKQKLPKDNTGHFIVVQDDAGERRIVAYCRTHRYFAEQVARNTTVLSEINTAVIGLITDTLAPSAPRASRSDIARHSNSARRFVAFSLFAGRR